MACQTSPRWLARNETSFLTDDRPARPFAAALTRFAVLFGAWALVWLFNLGLFGWMLRYVASIGEPVAR